MSSTLRNAKLRLLQEQGRLLYPNDYQKAHAAEGELLAKALGDYVNNYNHDHGAFVDTVTSLHRTLQQNTMRLLLKLIRAWSESLYFDDRNEATVKLCGVIMEAIQDRDGLPHI